MATLSVNGASIGIRLVSKLSTPPQRKGKELLKRKKKFEIKLALAEDGGRNARTQNRTESANG